jgi:FixJ family two-component response regulator
MSSVAISPGYGTRSAQVLGREFKSSLGTDTTPMVFVLDEDPSVREWLELVVRGGGWRCKTFVSTQEFLAYPPPSIANCLVLDAASCPDVLALQKRVALERPGMTIIFMASSIELATAVKAIKAGAVEFFTKPCSEEALLSSIREAIDQSQVMISKQKETRALRDRYSALTRREREVMELVASGLLNKQVGGQLGISEITVKAHRGQVMQKMKADSLADLVKMASRLSIAA